MFRSSVPYAVISIVSKQRDLSVQALHQQLSTKWVSVSLPNFYKIIAHMVDDQILIRPKWKIQLHALFMRYLFGITEESTKIYHAQETNTLQQIAIWQQETREESNLYELNVIRADLLGQLVKMHDSVRTYHYTSHPYFLLSTPLKEQTNLEDLASEQHRSHFLIGNTTFLDRYAAQQLSPELYETKCVDDAAFPEEWYSVDIIGDYIVECMFPRNVTEHFALFFNTIVGIEGYNKELFCQVLKMKSPSTLKVIHSPEHAQRMKMKVEKYFSS